MQKWEIKLIAIGVNGEDHSAEITQAGLDGWELVTVVVVPYTKGTGIAYFFKRPIPSPQGFYTMHIEPKTGHVDGVSLNEFPVDSGVSTPSEKPDAE